MLAVRQDKKPAAGRQNLLTQLVLERITSRSHEGGYSSRWMEQGIEREEDARDQYEIATGRPLFTVGFLQHPTLAAGVSLDGYVGDFEGLIEAKCPIPATHLEFLETDRIPDNYLKQITHALWITGAEWAEYLSFNPDFPEGLQVKVRRVLAKDLALDAYEGLVKQFLAEVDAKEAAVRKLMKKSEAA